MTDRPALGRFQQIAIGTHLLLAATFLFYGLATTGDAEGFSSLARLVVVLLAAIYLVGLTVAWGLARFVVRGTTPRLITLIAVPPLFVIAAVALVRAA